MNFVYKGKLKLKPLAHEPALVPAPKNKIINWVKERIVGVIEYSLNGNIKEHNIKVDSNMQVTISFSTPSELSSREKNEIIEWMIDFDPNCVALDELNTCLELVEGSIKQMTSASRKNKSPSKKRKASASKRRKSSTRKSRSRKPCKPGQVRNRSTGRCRKRKSPSKKNYNPII